MASCSSRTEAADSDYIHKAQPYGGLLLNRKPAATPHNPQQSTPHPSLNSLKLWTRRRNKQTSPTQIAYVINMSYEGGGGLGRVALQPLIGEIYGDREQEIKQRLTDERAREDWLHKTSTSRKKTTKKKTWRGTYRTSPRGIFRSEAKAT